MTLKLKHMFHITYNLKYITICAVVLTRQRYFMRKVCLMFVV